PRFGWSGGPVDLDTYFAMARGRVGGGDVAGRGASQAVQHQTVGDGVPAMEMTKWFDTNYHYIVPELQPDQTFTVTSRKPLDEFEEALGLGIRTKPVLLGPVSFLLLSKVKGEGVHPLELLDRLLPV